MTLINSSAAVAQGSSYVREGDALCLIENGISFPVDPEVVSARFLPEFGSLEGALAQLGEDAGVLGELSVVRSNRLHIVDLRLPEGADPLEVVAALRESGTVEFAEINTFGYSTGVPGDSVPNDPLFGDLWYLENTGQESGTPGADMSALEAWEIEDGDPSVVVAVIDSGGPISHEDLVDALWVNPGEIAGNGVDDDRNGFVDDTHGWDFLDDDNDPSSTWIHGGAVAGVAIAQGDNDLGVVGLAGGAVDGEGCAFLPIRVSNAGLVTTAVVDDAILYAADMGVRVINMSFGLISGGPSKAVGEACEYAWETAGVFVNAASGNFGGTWMVSPADLPHVVAVGATTRWDEHWAFSTGGPKLELTAPGADITLCAQSFPFGSIYTVSSGTSHASPQVSALAALLFSANPDLTNDDVRRILADTATDLGPPGWDEDFGAGRINAAAALAVATGTLGAVGTYGEGLAGSAGVPKGTWAGGLPQEGNAGFRLRLTAAAANAPAFLVLGFESASLPFKGGTLLVDPAPPAVILPTPTDAEGSASVPLPFAAGPLLVGLELYGQWAVVDAAAVQGFALTAGVEIVVGN